jgi:hypothetical protein
MNSQPVNNIYTKAFAWLDIPVNSEILVEVHSLENLRFPEFKIGNKMVGANTNGGKTL